MTPGASEAAVGTAAAFFKRLNGRDLAGPGTLAADETPTSVVPAGLCGCWGSDGRPYLDALFAAFPNLQLAVSSIVADDHGAVVEAVARTPATDGLANGLAVPQAWIFDLAGEQISGVRAIWSRGPLEAAVPGRLDDGDPNAAQRSGQTAPRSAQAQTALDFLACLGAHDVDGMIDRCDDMASFNDVAFRLHGRQRTLSGSGKMRGIGKVILTALVDAFPDLGLAVTGITDDGAGAVAVETMVNGTQAKPWWSVHSAGRSFASPYLFLFKIDGEQKIQSVTIYSDRAGQNRQLGLTEPA